MNKPDTGEWSDYQLMVLDKLDSLKDAQEKSEGRLRSTQEKVEERLRTIETEIALLRLKSSFWGAVAGLAAYAVTIAVQYLQKR
jgi:hypothetical protein